MEVSMNIKLVDLKRQFDPIKKDIYEEFDKIFDNTSFIMGENVKKFEEEFSSYIGVKHSISVGNGTDALVIALKSLGIKEGDELEIEDDGPIMKVLAQDGTSQMALFGGERIFSRKNTVVLIRKAKKADKTKSENDLRALGRYMFKCIKG